MRSVILCSGLRTLQRILPPPSEPLRFLILEDNETSLAIRTHLQHRGHAEELPRATLCRERSARFRSEYVTAVGNLNAEHSSLGWWAMPFTTKNPLSTRLCRDTFEFLLIVDLVREQSGVLIVVTGSETLVGQVESWGVTEGIRVVPAVQGAWSLKRWINRLASIALALRVVRALWFKMCIRWSGLKPVSERHSDVVLIVTPVHPSSITGQGLFHDTYFGGFSDWLKRHQASVIIAGLVDRLSVSLGRAFRRADPGGATVPLEAISRIGDILLCGWQAFRSYVDSGYRTISFQVGGVNVDYLLRAAIEEAHTSGNVFLSLCVYRAAYRLGSMFDITRCVYPYENRAWEKMLLLGLRAASPETKMVGYQHASITFSHTNFILAEKEGQATPLPDLIVTMGEVTRDWLVCEGHYPPALVKAGCALRQAQRGRACLRRRRMARPDRILVALATSLSEYVRALAFLQEAVTPADNRDICVRPHPTIRLQKAIQLLPQGHIRFPYTVSSRILSDDLAWADVVLYASSTVGLEAVSIGLPTVHLDLGDFLGTDPMDRWSAFKWVAREPEDLAKVFAEIEALPDSQYELLQREGLNYADAYLYPVTDQNLEAFFAT